MLNDSLITLIGYIFLSLFTGLTVYYVNVWLFNKELELQEKHYLDILASSYGFKRLPNESNNDFRIRITKDILKKEKVH